MPPEADSSISMLGADEKPDVSYADIGGMDMQKQEMREAVELPLSHFDLYKQIGIYPEIYSPFDMVWLILFSIGSNVLAPLWMLVVANAFCHLTEISLSKRLAMFDLNIFLHTSVITVAVTTGYCLTYYGHFLAVDQSLKQFGSTKSFLMVFGYISTSIYSCGFCYSLPMWLVIAWITNIRTMFESKNRNITIYDNLNLSSSL